MTYLDHGGTALHARRLIYEYSNDLAANLYGNPHSEYGPAQLSERKVDET